MSRPSLGVRVTHFFQREIWHSAYLNDRSWRGRLYAVLRIVSITLIGLDKNRATSRAAALSFSSLLGLGPLVAIAVLLAGLTVKGENPKQATEAVTNYINQLIKYIAPQTEVWEQSAKQAGAGPAGANPPASEARQARPSEASGNGNSAPSSSLPATPPPTPPTESASMPPAQKATKPVEVINPDVAALIEQLIEGTRSSTAGVVSAVSLIMVVLLLFTSVEGVFNDIWGVRSGRSWLTRLVFYWTILTLGAVLFFGAMTALSVSTFTSVFDFMPFGNKVGQALFRGSAIAIIIGILTVFYKFIPNTHVFWRPAIIGACVVTALLVLNNVLAFAYARRVTEARSLFGSVGLLAVLMFGLYVFWLFVLVGGQLSYAVQNVHFRNSQAAWTNLTASVRERLTLAVLLAIARRFQDCEPAATASELSATIKVPTQILNECLNRLVDLRLVSPVPPAPNAPADLLYQPARPLNKITLGDFVHLFDNFGEQPAGESIDRLDPVLAQYSSALNEATKAEFFSKPLDEILAETARSKPVAVVAERR